MIYGEVVNIKEYTLRSWGVPNSLGKASSELMPFYEYCCVRYWCN